MPNVHANAVSNAAQGSHGIPAFHHHIAVPSQVDDLVGRAPGKSSSLTQPTGKQGRALVDETLQGLLLDLHARGDQMAELLLRDQIETKTRSDAGGDLRSMHAAVLRYEDDRHGTYLSEGLQVTRKRFAAEVGVAAAPMRVR
jgi:hypothetical protein